VGESLKNAELVKLKVRSRANKKRDGQEALQDEIEPRRGDRKKVCNAAENREVGSRPEALPLLRLRRPSRPELTKHLLVDRVAGLSSSLWCLFGWPSGDADSADRTLSTRWSRGWAWT